MSGTRMRRNLMGAAVLAAPVFLFGAAAPAAAEEAVCASIGRAVHAMAASEKFHSKLEARTPGRRRPVQEERFVLGDLVYANSPAAGRWVKLHLTEEDRKGLETGLLAHPPQDCREEARQEIGGVPVRVFAYRQAMTGQDEAKVAESRLWVAEADGRPRRYEGRYGGVAVSVVYDYERVTPPFELQ
ncbi:hypothetical protein [Paracraurococcus lichenis]|uniref:Uncharacterized protein n=1 Tax=Paracraurococcus lichenis TaxID=3064888 RepID=A0ABT9DUV6_9PROT|nr:hypothetical protein [Paracraurococcus sp. LOR1-02]MDO9707658.1 hypothetical protein [Paracraurococcus sp. LOR1-02]